MNIRQENTKSYQLQIKFNVTSQFWTWIEGGKTWGNIRVVPGFMLNENVEIAHFEGLCVIWLIKPTTQNCDCITGDGYCQYQIIFRQDEKYWDILKPFLVEFINALYYFKNEAKWDSQISIMATPIHKKGLYVTFSRELLNLIENKVIVLSCVSGSSLTCIKLISGNVTDVHIYHCALEIYIDKDKCDKELNLHKYVNITDEQWSLVYNKLKELEKQWLELQEATQKINHIKMGWFSK